MQAASLLIFEQGARWLAPALARRTPANELVIALIQDREESAGAFRSRIEQRIESLGRSNVWLEQVLLPVQRRGDCALERGEMLLAIGRAATVGPRPAQVLLVPMALALADHVDHAASISTGP